MGANLAAKDAFSPRFWGKQIFAASFAGVKTLKRRKENTLSRRARAASCYAPRIKNKKQQHSGHSENSLPMPLSQFNVWTPLGLVMGACNVCRQWLKAHGKITLTSRPSAFYSQLWAAASERLPQTEFLFLWLRRRISLSICMRSVFSY